MKHVKKSLPQKHAQLRREAVTVFLASMKAHGFDIHLWHPANNTNRVKHDRAMIYEAMSGHRDEKGRCIPAHIIADVCGVTLGAVTSALSRLRKQEEGAE